MATLTLDLTATRVKVADTLPSTNFGFDDLRDRMNRFTQRFDAFIERERKRILDERNRFRMDIAELQEEKRHRNLDIEAANLKAHTHSKTIAKETQEAADARAEISEVKSRRDELLERREALRAEHSALQSTLAARRDAQAKHARYLHSQARWNGPELQFWEDYLCMRIEGAGLEDRLKFVFTHVCEKDWEREAWFELDTSDREYKVLKTWPKVEKEEVDACLEKLNEGRELGPFFKAMREIFVRAYK